MRSENEKVGELVRRGVLLFAKAVPFPASMLVAAVSAAAISKILELHERRVTEVLSSELTLSHISYVEPTTSALFTFFSGNPVYPELATEFSQEITSQNESRLRSLYPFLYSALILRRKIPSLMFHQEIRKKQFRQLTEKYEQLSNGYASVEGNAELQDTVNRFAGELLEVLTEVYDASRSELRQTFRKQEFALDVIDYIREVIAS